MLALRYLHEYERSQYLPPDHLLDMTWRRLRNIVRHAYDKCPYYRQLFDAEGIHPDYLKDLKDLAALPILEKRQIQQNRDEMVACDWPKTDLIANQTGGSTGRPISFFLSRDRLRSRSAGVWRHNRWASYDIGDKVALIWGSARPSRKVLEESPS